MNGKHKVKRVCLERRFLSYVSMFLNFLGQRGCIRNTVLYVGSGPNIVEEGLLVLLLV